MIQDRVPLPIHPPPIYLPFKPTLTDKPSANKLQ